MSSEKKCWMLKKNSFIVMLWVIYNNVMWHKKELFICYCCSEKREETRRWKISKMWTSQMMLMIKVLRNKLTSFNKDEMDEEHFCWFISVLCNDVLLTFIKYLKFLMCKILHIITHEIITVFKNLNFLICKFYTWKTWFYFWCVKYVILM